MDHVRDTHIRQRVQGFGAMCGVAEGRKIWWHGKYPHNNCKLWCVAHGKSPICVRTFWWMEPDVDHHVSRVCFWLIIQNNWFNIHMLKPDQYKDEIVKEITICMPIAISTVIPIKYSVLVSKWTQDLFIQHKIHNDISAVHCSFPYTYIQWIIYNFSLVNGPLSNKINTVFLCIKTFPKNIDRHIADTIVSWPNTEKTMGNSSYFRFDGDNKTKYIYIYIFSQSSQG